VWGGSFLITTNSSYLKESKKHWLQIFETFQNQRITGFEYFGGKKNCNQRTVNSDYFKYLKEPLGFMKELVKN
jgi:hypothetical protein